MNKDLKDMIQVLGLKQYDLAERMGISEFTLSRWLRSELTEDQEQRIKQAIKDAKADLLAKIKSADIGLN